MKKMIVAAMAACLSSGIYAANWEYDSSAKTISDGDWTFKATLSGSNITINQITAGGHPGKVWPLDFSKKVVKKGDESTEYTITVINSLFYDYSLSTKYWDGYQYVGEFTLPGEGLITMGNDGPAPSGGTKTELCGDIVIPSTVTSIGRYWFRGSKITSITFGAGTTTINGGDFCSKCTALTSVVFKAGGACTITGTPKTFENCTALKDVDLSGVVSITADKKYAVLVGCSGLTNLTLSSNLKLYRKTATGTDPIGNVLFNGNYTNLKTIRFTGAAPDDIENWVTGNERYLDVLSSSQDIATIVPVASRNVPNSSNKCWLDYSASGELNTTDSTWKKEYVKSDVPDDVSTRKLLLDEMPQEEGPTVWDPTVSGIWTNTVTITVLGSGLKDGSIEVSLTNAAGAVTGPKEVAAFDETCTFDTLTENTTYTVIVAATNDGGTTTNAAVTFRTYSEAEVSVVPTISSVVVSKTSGHGATITVSGDQLGTGSFKVEIYDSNEQLVTTSASVTGWGSAKVAGLAPETTYYARAIATHGLSGKSATSTNVEFTTTVEGWAYDSSTNPATISDGEWTFEAKLSGSNVTINKITEGGHPDEISPLDFSKKVFKKGDKTTEYVITVINALFYYYTDKKRWMDGAQYIGEFTLPGEGLVTMGGDGPCPQNPGENYHLYGDIVVPSTVTSIGRYWFQQSKITSIVFGAGKATVDATVCQKCTSLTSVVFRAGGAYTLNNNSMTFDGCTALKDADLSGVVSITAAGGKNKAALCGCNALTNVTLNSALVLDKSSSTDPIGNVLFHNNTALTTIRFTGAAPDEMPNWISDGKYLGIFSDTQDIATIVPTEYRNVKNSSNMSWEDYSASPAAGLNTTNSTWAAENVAADIDLAKRKLLVDKEPKKDGPTVTAPTVSDIWTNAVTITVNGGGLKGGTIEVSLTNATETVEAKSVQEFGQSCSFDGLTPHTEYTVIVVAENEDGVTTNATTTFTTLGMTTLAARAVYTSSDTTLTFRYDGADWSSVGTVYEIGDGSGATWAEALKTTLTRVVFMPSFKDFRPTSCANWFKECAQLASIEGLEYLDTRDVTSTSSMFEKCSKIASFDISAFRTPKLTTCESMFNGCTILTNIYANENFVNYYASGNNTFRNSEKLVGGNGSANTNGIYQSYLYARVDRAGVPGMFTYRQQPDLAAKPTILACEFHDRTAEGGLLNLVGMDLGAGGTVTITVHPASDPTAVTKVINATYLGEIPITGLEANTSYILDITVGNSFGDVTLPQQSIKTKRTPVAGTAKLVFDDENLTATFCYDNESYDEFKKEGETNVYVIADSGATWTKHPTKGSITNVIFDASFANYYPKSCAQWLEGFGGLLKVDGIENLDTSDVTSMRSMFAYASSLTSLDVSGFDTSHVTDMASMFYKCGARVLDLTGFNTAKVSVMSQMFAYSGYDRLNLSSFNTSNVTAMTEMFVSCQVGQICVSELWSTEKVAPGTVVFGKNGSNLTGGAGTTFDTNHVDVSYARIDNPPDEPGYLTYLKTGAPSIFSVVVSGVTTNSAKVTVYGEGLLGGTIFVVLTNALGVATEPETIPAFGGNCTFDTLDMNTGYAVIAAAENSNGATTNATVTFKTAGVTNLAARATYTAYDTTLTFTYDACDRSGFGTVYDVGIGTNPVWAAELKSTLTRVVFDPSFTNTQPTSCAKWFYECSQLTSVEGMENLDASEVTDMNNMFSQCSKLVTLDLSALRTPKLLNLEYTFAYCSFLTTIYANENFVSYFAKGNMTFHNSSKLEGGNGTSNAGNLYTSYTYACVDRAGTPGLFTYKEAAVAEKPTILATDFHDRTSEGGMLNIVGMGLGSAGTITITVHPATNTALTVTNIEVNVFGDVAITGLEQDTTYIVDIVAENGVGSAQSSGISIKTRRDAPEGATAKVVFDEGKMTFYYDDIDHAGTVYEIKDTGCTWTNQELIATITNATFDASFRCYYPKSCKSWFSGFANLQEIVAITNLDTSEVTSMADMFRGTSALAELDLTKFDTANVTDMSGMFRQVGVRVLDITGFNTAKVTTMSEMFAYWCPNKINVSSFNTSNVTAMTGMFTGCKVKQISVSELWSTQRVPAGTKVFGSNLGADVTLTGQAGTAYVYGNDDVSYARLDEGDAAPGYFTYARPGEKPDTLPVISSVDITGVTTNGATITVSGSELDSGYFHVEILSNGFLHVMTSARVDDWGSVRVTGLQPATLYYARAIATNGESKKSAAYEDVDFTTASQTDIAWVTFRDAGVDTADDGKSATFSVQVNTCNVDGDLVLMLNGVEMKRWTLSDASAGEIFSETLALKPFEDYTWQFQASGTAEGVKAVAASSGSFTASVRETWVNVAFEGGSYDVSSREIPTTTEDPVGTWTLGSDSIDYAASDKTANGNDVRIEGEVEAFAVDEDDDIPSNVKAAFGFVAYDGALKPAVWANGSWHPFGFRVFTPGDMIAYTLTFDMITDADTPCVQAVVGTETSDWYEIDAPSQSLRGFVFDGGANLGDFRGWRYKAKPAKRGLVIVFD